MFFRKLITFLSLLFIVLIGCLLLNKLILDKLFKKESKLPVETKWIAIGDSHITNAVNPENYPWLVNRAHSGERLPYNLEKIKFYIENNPQVELVILGYWFNTMFYNKDWVLHGKDVKYRYESYLPLMLYNNTNVDYLNVPENRSLFLENYWGYKIGYPSPSVKLLVKNYFTFNENLEMRGGFLKARLKYKAQKSNLKKDTTALVVDPLALDNLNEIVSFLKQKKVKLVFYNTPVRSEFLEPLSDSNIKLTDSIANSFVDREHVWYLNYTKKKMPDSYFNDKHHLNVDGANYITPILVDTILKITNEKQLNDKSLIH